MAKITDAQLDDLIVGLQEYKDKGVVDPWVFEDGTTVEPLEVLRELQEFRKKYGIEGVTRPS